MVFNCVMNNSRPPASFFQNFLSKKLLIKFHWPKGYYYAYNYSTIIPNVKYKLIETKEKQLVYISTCCILINNKLQINKLRVGKIILTVS